MIRRHWPAVSIAAAILAAGLNLQAQPPASPAPTPATPPTAGADVTLKDVVARQQELERRYKAFTTNLLALAQKLEKSDRIEDKDKAKALRKAIDLADKEGVDNKFSTLLRTLLKSSDLNLSDINSARNQNDELIKVLRQILDILQSDDELARIKEEQKWLEKLLAELNGIIRGEKIVDARTNSNKGDPKQLGREQGSLRDKTDALADKMGAARTGPSKNNEPKSGTKSEPKEGGDPTAEEKDDTKDPKAGERSGGDKGDPMKGDGADNKPSKGGPPQDGQKGSKGGPPNDDKQPSGDKQGQKDPTADNAATVLRADRQGITLLAPFRGSDPLPIRRPPCHEAVRSGA